MPHAIFKALTKIQVLTYLIVHNGNKNKSMESVQYEIAYYRSRSKIFENDLTLLQ